MSNVGTVELFPGQPLLPGIMDKSALGSELLENEDYQRANYSGKIVEKNQERVQGILSARAFGFPIRQICEAFSVSAHTIAEVERRHSVKLATLKDRLARKFGVFIELGIDRAISEVDNMDRDKLLVSLGIASDKLQVLTGEATVIIGSADGAKKFSIDNLRARLGGRGIIDVTPTGSVVEGNTQTREAIAAEGDNESPEIPQ